LNQTLPEKGSRKPVAAVVSGKRAKNMGLGNDFNGELTTAPRIGVKVRRCGRMTAVEIIEQSKFGPAAPKTPNPNQTERLQPKVIGGKIVNRRINEQDARPHEVEGSGSKCGSQGRAVATRRLEMDLFWSRGAGLFHFLFFAFFRGIFQSRNRNGIIRI